VEKVLQVDIEKCSGCRTCEVVCSLKNTGECNPTRSRIRVIRYEKHGEFHNFIPMVCQQCSNALCMEACPVNAISRDHETGALIVDAQTCVGCKVCSMVCPIGGVSMDPITNVAYKCDLCGGDPECVKYCDLEAITFIPKDKADLFWKRVKSEKLYELFALMQSLR
jgi:carbon-monoxide dehydrogenase iron sulfur subunit